MKRVMALFLLCVVFLAGCSGNQGAVEIPQGNTNVTQQPEEIIDASVLRTKGIRAILDLVPSEFLLSIPVAEIAGAQASLNHKTCNVLISWRTDKDMKDVAAMLGAKLNYDLVQGEDDMRNPEGADYPNARLKKNGSMLDILYILTPEQGVGTLLTGSFPLDKFKDLPEELDLSIAERTVTYNERLDAWEYQLNWRLASSVGSKVWQNSLTLYSKNDGYNQKVDDIRGELSYNIAHNEKMSIDCNYGDEYHIKARYEFKTPVQASAELMQQLIDSTGKVLLSELTEGYLSILKDYDVLGLSYRPTENMLTYSIQGPKSEDVQPIAVRAGQVIGVKLTANDRGGYQCGGQDYAFTIKLAGDRVGWELEKKQSLGFVHPYIHDVFPASFVPNLPEALKAEPQVLQTGYSEGETGVYVSFERTWLVDEATKASNVFKELGDSIKGYPGYNVTNEAGRQVANCSVKGYGVEYSLAEQGSQRRITIAIRYRVPQDS